MWERERKKTVATSMTGKRFRASPSSLEAGLIYKSEFALLRRFICVRQLKFEGVHQYVELRRKFNIEGVHSYAERRNLQAKK